MITYIEYTNFGYSLIPEAEFERYAARAFLTAIKYTFNRLDKDNLTEYNKRGLCELAELFYSDAKQINKPLLSFQNGNYSEMYGLPSTTNIQTIDDNAYAIVRTYFTSEQLCRAVS